MASSPNEPEKGAGDAGVRDASSLMDEAEAELAAGHADEAADLALRAAATKVAPARALPLLARTREAQGDLTAALDVWSQAMDAAPKDPQISGETGRLALRLGKYALAERVLSTHVRQAPPTAEAIARLAWAQTGQKAFDRAQATLQAALEADAAQPWLALAKLLCVQGRHAQGVVFFEESLRLVASSSEALDGIADALLLGAGVVERAISAGEAALAAGEPG